MIQPVQQVRPPFGEVDDAGSHALGMHAQPQDVDRRLEQGRRGSLDEQGNSVVGRHQIPAGVDHLPALRGELGVSKSLWGDACQAMGREQAAIAIAIVSAKPAEHFRTSPEYGAFCRRVAEALGNAMAGGVA